MHQPLQLQIAEPCHENWNQMTPKQQGRFCGSCQKIVVDFTTMSDSQLLEYFKNYNSNTCGRFDDTQLDRMLTLPPVKPSWYKWTVAAVFSGFLISNKAKAQDLVGRIDMEVKQKPVAQKKGEVVVSLPQKISELRGKIVDENGAGIPYSSVEVVGASWGAAADSLGNFTLKSKGSNAQILLTFSSVGFLQQTKIINFEDQKDGLTIVLSKLTSTGLADVVVALSGRMGGVTVSRTVKRTTKLIELITTKKQGIKLFPNPAKAGSSVAVQFEKTGDYTIRLIDLAGRLLISQSNIVFQKGRFFNLQIPAQAVAGQYFVQLINEKSKIAATEKLTIVD